MDVKDDFLDGPDLIRLQNALSSGEFPWYYNHFILSTHRTDADSFQFVHTFYANNDIGFQSVHSANFKILYPILEKLDIKSLIRVKANLRTRCAAQSVPEYHKDYEYNSTTAIFYVNTNDGYTLMKDGTKVESVENRLLTFPANTEHTGVSQTDSKVRIVVNFNYF